MRAVIEPAAGAIVDRAQLLAFAAEHLAAFKLPQSIDVIDALPREASGKLKKRVLRDRYWKDVELS